MKKKSGALQVIGWREWLALPGLGVDAVKAKVDTGARSSSLHAFDLSTFHRKGKDMVRFKIHPIQRSKAGMVQAESEVLEYRSVKSSTGESSIRPVIVTQVVLLNQRWDIELTLANRDEMGFRMLLGREAIRGRMLVDSSGSFYGGKVSASLSNHKSHKDESPKV